jgi:ferredoxin
MSKVILDRNKCIGCGLCSNVSSDDFGFDGKATLIGGNETSLDIFEAERGDISGSERAASVCPVRAIRIED